VVLHFPVRSGDVGGRRGCEAVSDNLTHVLHRISIPLSSRHALRRGFMNNLMNEISLHTKITGHVLQIIFESLRCKFVPDFRFRCHGLNSRKH
jgi:hypothetical protein